MGALLACLMQTEIFPRNIRSQPVSGLSPFSSPRNRDRSKYNNLRGVISEFAATYVLDHWKLRLALVQKKAQYHHLLEYIVCQLVHWTLSKCLAEQQEIYNAVIKYLHQVDNAPRLSSPLIELEGLGRRFACPTNK